jgi:hypothetical protein
MNHRGAAATEVPAVALQYRNAAWRAAWAPTGEGAKAVNGQGNDAWRGEAEGGRRRPRAAHCASGRAPGAEQGSGGARKKKGYELNQGLTCKIREKQGPY